MVVCDKCGKNLSAPMASRVDIEPHRSGIFCGSFAEGYEMTRTRTFCPDCWLELMSSCKPVDEEESDDQL